MKITAKTVAVAVIAIVLSSAGLSGASATQDLHTHHSSIAMNQSFPAEQHAAHVEVQNNLLAINSLIEHCAFACIMCLLTFVVMKSSKRLRTPPVVVHYKCSQSFNYTQTLNFFVPPHKQLVVLRM